MPTRTAAPGQDATSSSGTHQIHFGDNLEVLRGIASASVDLIYIDPPFNTGSDRKHRRIEVARAEEGAGDRTGFGGRRYVSRASDERRYSDAFDDFLDFLTPRLFEAHRVLADHGSFYFHIDYREAHYCKVLLDSIFGRRSFLNEIIWAYDYGGRGKRRWPAKHDTILFYVKDPDNYFFDLDAVERIPYMAPELVTPEKAARGKSPTDTWWHTIVPTNSRERTGYPTQKPVGILRRIVSASSRPGDTVLDFFAGSGTAGAACLELQRRFILVDDNAAAIEVMRRRFAGVPDIHWFGAADAGEAVSRSRAPGDGMPAGRAEVDAAGAEAYPVGGRRGSSSRGTRSRAHG